jgi:hypothetical protein
MAAQRSFARGRSTAAAVTPREYTSLEKASPLLEVEQNLVPIEAAKRAYLQMRCRRDCGLGGHGTPG